LLYFWFVRQSCTMFKIAVVALAKGVATTQPQFRGALESLSSVEAQLERARLASEDTLCRDSMPAAERLRRGAALRNRP